MRHNTKRIYVFLALERLFLSLPGKRKVQWKTIGWITFEDCDACSIRLHTYTGGMRKREYKCKRNGLILYVFI